MFRTLAAALFTLAFCQATVSAQSGAVNLTYGKGVHAYFRGMYSEAHELFSAAIESGSKDPRCFYFRGLAYEMLGRPDEANGDFASGAEFETGSTDRFYNVSKSLERVQGRTRARLETYRVKARLAFQQEAARRRAERYERIRRIEPAILQRAEPVRPITPSVEREVVVPVEPDDTSTPDLSDDTGLPAAENDLIDEPAIVPEVLPAEDDTSPAVDPATTPAEEEDPFGADADPSESEDPAADDEDAGTDDSGTDDSGTDDAGAADDEAMEEEEPAADDADDASVDESGSEDDAETPADEAADSTDTDSPDADGGATEGDEAEEADPFAEDADESK